MAVLILLNDCSCVHVTRGSFSGIQYINGVDDDDDDDGDNNKNNKNIKRSPSLRAAHANLCGRQPSRIANRNKLKDV